MSIFYFNSSKKEPIRQPLFRRIRSYYRGPRKSSDYNLTSQQMYMDIQRISLELEQTNAKILQDVKIILDKELDNETSILQNDGSKVFSINPLNNSKFKVQWKTTTGVFEEKTLFSTMDTISSKISKINMKLNRLEN